MTAYYNEFDPYAAQWLRNLIEAGHIAPGDVDERDIRDVQPDDLRGYDQCHFFAGIGGWGLAMRLAGWPDDRPVWTGSCPCQPFSNAGQRRGTADERHLWPHWFRLIRECRPSVVFGEQVAAAIRHGWLDLVFDDMEAAGYACGAAVLPAGAVGAPHRRERLWFVGRLAHADSEQRHRRGDAGQGGRSESPDGGAVIGMADANLPGPQGRYGGELCECADQFAAWTRGSLGKLEHAGSIGRSWREAAAPGHDDDGATSERAQGEHGPCVASAHRLRQHGASQTNGHWRSADWLLCRDGLWRPVEPGTFPLAHGVPARVGRLRAYGNAIVAPLAAEFIKAYQEC